ncbi:MAG: hypothetical protein IJV98_06835 [Clostridia bacterium]|nr:hypothetical protein [Clostridia bacterium]
MSKTQKRLLIAALAVLCAVYLGYHIGKNFKKDVSLFTVRPYTAEDTAVFTGYILREETVLYAHTVPGMCRYRYYDGEKVGANKVVADVYQYANDALKDKVASYRKQIEILRRSSSLGRLSEEEISERIDRLSFTISEKNASGDTAAAGALGDELLVLMAKRDLLISGKTNYDAEITVLEAELSSLLLSLGTPIGTVSTPRSGYFYAGTDGYESILRAELAKGLTLSGFDALISTPPSVSSGAVGTLLTSSEWYYATKTSAQSAEGFTVGKTYECLFIDNGYSETIPMKLVSREVGESEALLVFFSASLPRDFDITRCQRMEAARAEYTGYRVPAETVRVKNGVTCVYVFKEGSAYLREIEILWEQNGYFIVSDKPGETSVFPPLKLNDLIILGEKDLSEGKFMQ